uniref:Uncharacterized protein n=1 Tax=Rhizophagus irregularis (strain DAOM 181602 / DAOM 197198 / MUCL 43194) TaxID=747089 RepID=U9TBK0_RHIID
MAVRHEINLEIDQEKVTHVVHSDADLTETNFKWPILIKVKINFCIQYAFVSFEFNQRKPQ